MHSTTLAKVYAQWVNSRSEYFFEKWIRTQPVGD